MKYQTKNKTNFVLVQNKGIEDSDFKKPLAEFVANRIQEIKKSRVGIKFNSVSMTESGKVYICRDSNQGIEKALYEVKSRLLNKEFDNIVNVTVDGANGCFGPNVQPSQKALKRLTSMINGTGYRVVQQNGQYLTLEGIN